MNSHRSLNILLIEDSQADVLLFQEALSDSNIQWEHVTDGEKAIQYFQQQEHNPGQSLPNLIVLDLNLPRVHGHEVLEYLKSHPKLAHIPVFVWTTSNNRTDVEQSYNSHANGHLIKPPDLAGFFSMVQKLESFWTHIATLPMPSFHP